MKPNQQARIENWTLFMGSLLGEVYGHPHFREGEVIVTSPIQDIDTEKKIARSQNTIYTLGVKYDLEKAIENVEKNTVSGT